VTVMRERLAWWLRKRADIRSLTRMRVSNAWAAGQPVTRRARRRLRKEARRDLTL
jgi:hypothetical protein